MSERFRATTVAVVRESLQLGGGRIDFALHMGGVALGIVIAQQAPLLLLLVFGAAGLAWSFSARVQLATTSWLRMVYGASLVAQPAVDDSLEDVRTGTVYRGYRQRIGATRDGASQVGTVVVREEGNIVSQLFPRWGGEFDWGKLSDEGADLAWTLLGNGVGPEVYEGFRRSVVAELPDTWRLAAEDIEEFARCWPLSATARSKSANAVVQTSASQSSDSDRLESANA